MRTADEIQADAEARSPFSNGTEYELWADRGKGCYDCVNEDDADADKFCPILTVALLGNWPKEWTRRRVDWEIGGSSGSYEVVDECVEFEERRDPGDDDPPPEPPPTPELPGQVDMFEVFADQVVERSQVVHA